VEVNINDRGAGHIDVLQGVIPMWLNSLVDGSWSIVAEVYFYVIFPLVLYRFCATPRSAFRTYLAVLLIAIVTALIPSLQLKGNFGYYNFLYQLPCFMVGVVAYRIITQSPELSTMRHWSQSFWYSHASYSQG
jgi:peptidoglycan/LPS O-acetylase OafA/YrhL